MSNGNETNNKRYYWLKLDDHFFKDIRIKRLRKLAGGDTFTIIYLKLMLLSIRFNGLLVYEGVYDTFEEEMADKIDEEKENVAITISYLRQQCLLIEKADGDGYLPQAAGSIGSETYNNVYKRRRRQAEIGTGDGLEKFQPNSNQIPIDKDIEIDKDIYIPPTHACAREDDGIKGMSEFCEKYNISIEGYDATLKEIDFILLAQFYEKSKTFLQIKPFARSLKWICKNYGTIITGYYNDFSDTAEKSKKGVNKGGSRNGKYSSVLEESLSAMERAALRDSEEEGGEDDG